MLREASSDQSVGSSALSAGGEQASSPWLNKDEVMVIQGGLLRPLRSLYLKALRLHEDTCVANSNGFFPFISLFLLVQ